MFRRVALTCLLSMCACGQALILADARRLVCMVVPQPLLHMSRAIFRARFSTVVHRRVLALEFDRGSALASDAAHASWLLNKLRVARRSRAVVCASPGAIKSIQLKCVCMQWFGLGCVAQLCMADTGYIVQVH